MPHHFLTTRVGRKGLGRGFSLFAGLLHLDGRVRAGLLVVGAVDGAKGARPELPHDRVAAAVEHVALLGAGPGGINGCCGLEARRESAA